MQGIGEELREKRESINIDIEEVATDLGVDAETVRKIEAGDRSSFVDIFDVKEFIRKYAKYLGLDSDRIINDFNEFLFDFTSRIPVQAIEIAKKEKAKQKEEVKSPYTIPRSRLKPYFTLGGLLLVVILGILFTYLIIYYTNSDALAGFVN